jgi:hypothetical protein
VTTYPLALERCRTACAEAAAPQPNTSSHACHEAAQSGPSVRSGPQACGHSDEARAADIAGLAPSKLRAHLVLAVTAVLISPLHSDVTEVLPPPRTTMCPAVDTPRNLPLRL